MSIGDRTEFLSVVALVLLTLLLGVPDAQAATGGSYWVCRVSGADGKDYNSDLFTGPDSGYTSFPAAFAQFVKSKYSVKAFEGSPTCTNYGSLGQQQAQDAIKGFASYSNGVMTGWKGDTAAPAAAPPSTTQAANGLYYVCTWSIGLGAKPHYVSDVSGPTQLPPNVITAAFGKYVAEKYDLGNLSTAGAKSCVYQNSADAAQKLRQRDLTKPPEGYQVIDTGWKYSAGG